MNRIAFVGRKGLGGVRMRGKDVAERLGVPFLDLSEVAASGHWDTLVLVKYFCDQPRAIRRACDRLIFDPLDMFSKTKSHAEPVEFWEWCKQSLQFDEMIATSPACAETMAGTLRHVHLAPHHADPRVGPGWYDPTGPVVYAGGLRFIQSGLPAIREACQRLGRKLVVDDSRDCWKSLRGAALSLCLRLPPEDTPLNRHCKPGVKIENAAAAGLPVLASDDPCSGSLRPEAATIASHPCSDWAGLIRHSLESEPLTNPVTLDQHVNRMAEILGLQ